MLPNSRHLASAWLLVFALSFGYLARATEFSDGDISSLPVDVISIWNSPNPDHRAFNSIIGDLTKPNPYGGLGPDFEQIDPVLNGFVTGIYQNWVSSGSTAYDNGYRVVVEWSWGENTFQSEYLIVSISGVVRAMLTTIIQMV